MKDLNYWKNNCKEDCITTPISVLRYITELEKNNEAEKLISSGVGCSFIYVLKAKDRCEPLWVYKTYSKAYKGKEKYSKLNWANTYIEKWKIS